MSSASRPRPPAAGSGPGSGGRKRGQQALSHAPGHSRERGRPGAFLRDHVGRSLRVHPMGVPSTVLATGTPQGASAFHGSGAGFTGELRPREVEQLTQGCTDRPPFAPAAPSRVDCYPRRRLLVRVSRGLAWKRRHHPCLPSQPWGTPVHLCPVHSGAGRWRTCEEPLPGPSSPTRSPGSKTSPCLAG